MIRPLLILRPQEGALDSAARAKKLGLEPLVEPIFALEPVPWTLPMAGDYDALLLTSANAVRYAGSNLANLRHLPVLAVGEATAAAARDAQLAVSRTGVGGAQMLINDLADSPYQRLLWLTGKQHTKFETGNVSVQTVIVYHAKPLALGAQSRLTLADNNGTGGAVILVHSVRAAQQLEREMDRWQLPRAAHRIAALSEKIADAIDNGWKIVEFAAQPTDDALLCLASRLCME